MNDHLDALTTIFDGRPITVATGSYFPPISDNHVFHHPLIIFDPERENLDSIRASIALLPFKFDGGSSSYFIPSPLLERWQTLNPSYGVDGELHAGDPFPSRKLGCVLEWALKGSAALTSNDPEASSILDRLTTVAHTDTTVSVAEQLAQIHDKIAPLLPQLPPTPAVEKTPFVFPSLLSIYDELTTGIFIIPDDSQLIRETDWEAVSEWFGTQFETLLITTDSHFKLLSQYILSVSLTTGNVRHNWGQTLLTEGMIAPSELVGRALHSVLLIYLNVLPNAYMAAGEDEEPLRKVAHDIMNDLLRITFRHDVLSFDLPETTHTAPEPFSDDKEYTTQSERIMQIYDYVGEWVTFYNNLYAEL